MLSTNKKFADVYRKESLLVYPKSNKFASANKFLKRKKPQTEQTVMLLHRTRFLWLYSHSCTKKDITVQKRLYFDIKKFVSGLKAEGTKHRVDCYTANTKHQFTWNTINTNHGFYCNTKQLRPACVCLHTNAQFCTKKDLTVTNNPCFGLAQYRTTQNLFVRHRNIEKFFTQSQKSPSKGLFVFCVCL